MTTQACMLWKRPCYRRWIHDRAQLEKGREEGSHFMKPGIPAAAKPWIAGLYKTLKPGEIETKRFKVRLRCCSVM